MAESDLTDVTNPKGGKRRSYREDLEFLFYDPFVSFKWAVIDIEPE